MKIRRPFLYALLGVVALFYAFAPILTYGGATFPKLGDNAVTRIFVSTDTGEEFECSATYIAPAGRTDENGRVLGALILTAGHCIDAHLAPDPDYAPYVFGLIDWRLAMQGNPGLHELVYDFAVGSVPDVREGELHYHTLAETMPTSGTVYIHGFPLGVEKIAAADIVGACGTEDTAGDCDDVIGSYEVLTLRGEIQPGSSGSPVLDTNGNVVGIVWGVSATPYSRNLDAVLVTPIQAVRQALALMEAQNAH